MVFNIILYLARVLWTLVGIVLIPVCVVTFFAGGIVFLVLYLAWYSDLVKFHRRYRQARKAIGSNPNVLDLINFPVKPGNGFYGSQYQDLGYPYNGYAYRTSPRLNQTLP